MFLGIDPFYCIIYRLAGFIDHDFSSSEEGEATESWGVVSINTPCRYDMGSGSTRRRLDGMVMTARRRFYVEPDVDIREGDRIVVNNLFYKVVEVDESYNARAEIHHYECLIEIIDWKLPDYPTQWTDPDETNNSEIKEIEFSYNTSSPIYGITLDVDDTLLNVAILVEEAFDDNNATITIGTASDNDSIASVTPDQIVYYNISPYYKATATEIFNVYINPLTSTSGSGRIYLEVLRG